MRSGATAFVRLVTILVMALGFGAMTGFSAGAQDGSCQVIDADNDGQPEIVQGDCSGIENPDDTTGPCQVIDADGDDVPEIIQGDCEAETDTDTATDTETETNTATETETDTDTATETETETDTDDGGQAEEEEDVEDLPDTGQGPASDQGNSSSIVLLLGAMSVLLLGAATALRQGRQA